MWIAHFLIHAKVTEATVHVKWGEGCRTLWEEVGKSAQVIKRGQSSKWVLPKDFG